MLDDQLATDVDRLLGDLVEAGAPESGSVRDIRVVATVVLARIQSNFRAMQLLIATGFHQEAQALLRCLIEGAIGLFALKADPDRFMRNLRSDTAKGLQATVGMLQDDEAFKIRMAEVFGEEPSQRLIWKQLAEFGGADGLYQKYAFYSNTAVHVSGMSLVQHPAMARFDHDISPGAAALSIGAQGEAQGVAVIAGGAYCSVVGLSEAERRMKLMERVFADLEARGFVKRVVSPAAKPTF